jgi:hypothetical protein
MKKPKSYKIIVAHPDDEVLFFSSLLSDADTVHICFSGCEDQTVTRGRQKFESICNQSNFHFVNFQESDCHDLRNWAYATTSPHGLKTKFNSEKYENNFMQLYYYFREVLEVGDIIFTHNPWGEYGHEEHVQVFRVLSSLREELNLTIFVGGYVSNRSHQLMERSYHLLSDAYFTATIDQQLNRELKLQYQECNCWTWYDSYFWPKSENFFLVVNALSTEGRTSTRPLTYLTGTYNQRFLMRITKNILPSPLFSLLSLVLKTIRRSK